MEITSNLIGNRYKIIRNIGSGSMGLVFLVHDIKLDCNWAAKLVNNVTSNELLALKSVSHPAFPRIVDTIAENDNIWFIMDYIEGSSLSEYAHSARVSKKNIIHIAYELAQALNYLHTMSPTMLHLDCKPANIILDSSDKLHMIDLGSIYLPNSPSPGRISGTAGYAAPEQRLGQSVDIRADIYSYGRTLMAIIPGPDTPEIIQSIIKKCIQKNPSNRFQSMREILECLEHPSMMTHLSIQNILKNLIIYAQYFMLTVFTILGYYSYSRNNDGLYLILATLLFSVLILVCHNRSYNSLFTHWSCQKDIFLSMGKRNLPIIFAFILASILSVGLPANASENNNSYTTDTLGNELSKKNTEGNNYRVTLYTSDNSKILFCNQQLKITPDGSVYLYIPLSSMTPDTIPTKIELSCY